VDLERENRPIDLLPDRQAETVAAWLKAHPGVQIAVRDRAGAYAEGVRAGAPEAVQAADRRHLLHNLGDALAGVLDRHHRAIGAAAKAATAVATATVAVPTVPPLEPPPPTRSQQRSRDKQAARQARFDEVAALAARGWSQSAISRTTGLDRKTIRMWLRAGQRPSCNKPARGSMVDAYGDYLRRRWSEGCTNATRLWREIRERGFAGRPSIVRDWVRRLRAVDPTPAGSVSAATKWKAPSGRRAAWLVVADAGEIDDTEQKFVEALIAGSPELRPVIALAREFRAMVRQKQVDRLDGWLTAAHEAALAGFVGGLKRDLAAIRAALSLPWSTGPVEGRISRLKTIKRTMCGRAGFDLLRHRVLEGICCKVLSDPKGLSVRAQFETLPIVAVENFATDPKAAGLRQGLTDYRNRHRGARHHPERGIGKRIDPLRMDIFRKNTVEKTPDILKLHEPALWSIDHLALHSCLC
jgi:transposase